MQVRGYYVRDGRRVSFDAALPTTLPPHGVSQFVVSKVNPGDELKVSVSGPERTLRGQPPIWPMMTVAVKREDDALERTGPAI